MKMSKPRAKTMPKMEAMEGVMPGGNMIPAGGTANARKNTAGPRRKRKGR